MAEQVLRQRRVPGNKGSRYPADPPTIDRRPSTVDRRPSTVEEIVAVMREAGDGRSSARIRGLIVVLWRAGLRISEALMLNETDLDPSAGSVLVRLGKGGRRRQVGMDPWGWEQLRPWLERRRQLPVGPLFCVIQGPGAGRRWRSSSVRADLHRLAAQAGVRRRFAPHQLRHAHAVEMAHEGIPLNVIQHQLGHANLGVTCVYLQASTTPRSSPRSAVDRSR